MSPARCARRVCAGICPWPTTPRTPPARPPRHTGPGDAAADFHDDSGEPPSETSAPAPGPERSARLGAASRVLATFSGRLLLITGAVVVLGYVLGLLWSSVLLPVVLGLLFATVMWPLAKLLRRASFPPALAALDLGRALPRRVRRHRRGHRPAGGLAGRGAGPRSELGSAERAGLAVRATVRAGVEQIGQYVDDAIDRLQASAGDIATYALTGASAVGSGLVTSCWRWC